MAKPKPTAPIGYPLILAAILAAALPRLTAQSPAEASSMAPSPALDCFPYLIKLSDCLTFVETGSNLTKPEAGCCPELANLVNTEPICLCELLGNPSQAGISVDVNRALKLPSVCTVTTPPIALCAAAGFPVGRSEAPSPSPSPSPSDGGSLAASPHQPSWSPNNLASKHHYLIGLAALFFTYFF